MVRLMKICRDNSAFHGWQAGPGGGMMQSMAGASLPTKQNLSPPVSTKEHIMAWTTPAATDLRFGFEITMYIANR